MALVDIYRSHRDELLSKSIRQLLQTAGDGSLKDGNSTSRELREFLTQVPAEKLIEYGNYCLSNKFESSGVLLQDVVNEIGRRLEYKVQNGRYKGVVNAIGFDGIWKANGHAVVLEVKTSDVYTISLEVINKYFDRLVAEKLIHEEKSSILIVVGRSETSNLEDAIRGNLRSNKIRLISFAALSDLLLATVNTTSPHAAQSIRRMLIPHESVKLDSIVGVLLKIAEELAGNLTEIQPVSIKKGAVKLPEKTYEDALKDDHLISKGKTAFHKQSQVTVEQTLSKQPDEELSVKQSAELRRQPAIKRFEDRFGETLLKRRHSLYFATASRSNVVVFSSKKYEDSLFDYWFTVSEVQIKHLKSSNEAYLLFSCGEANAILLVPFSKYQEMHVHLPIAGNGTSRNIFIHSASNRLTTLNTSGKSFEFTEYQI